MHKEAATHSPLTDLLDERQLEACEVLDTIEDMAWSLCGDIRDLRIRLGQIESVREKLEQADR